jgi:hypothetical protein
MFRVWIFSGTSPRADRRHHMGTARLDHETRSMWLRRPLDVALAL